MYNIDYNSFRSVKGFNRRVRFLVMHYTALNFKDSIDVLTGPSVSAHYLENERAWHAGVSYWDGRNNLNDTAIGIETVNLATDNDGVFTFPPYNVTQIAAIKALASNILYRFPDITPVNVVGHSDIAPGRKSDPGAAFPWKALYDAGIGAWYDDETKQRYLEQFLCGLPSKNDIISKLKRYGYDTSGAVSEVGYNQLIRAFQLHFRPCNYDGIPDAETVAILYALVDKYKP